MADPVAPNLSPPPTEPPLVLDPIDTGKVGSSPPPPVPEDGTAPPPSRSWLPAGVLADPSPNVRHLHWGPALGLTLTTIPLEYFKHRLITQGLVLDDAVARGEVPTGQASSIKTLITLDRAGGQALGAVEGLSFYYATRYSRENWVGYSAAGLGLTMGIYRLAANSAPDTVKGPDLHGYDQARLVSAIYPILGSVNGALARIGDSTESRAPGIVGSYLSFGTGLYFAMNDDRAGMDRDTGTLTMALAGTHLTLQKNPWISATGVLSQMGVGTYLLIDDSPVHAALLMQTALSTAELHVDGNWSYAFDAAGLVLGGVQLGRGETAAGLIHGIPSLLFGSIRLLSTTSEPQNQGTGRRNPSRTVADWSRHLTLGTIRGPQSAGTGLLFSGEF